MFSFRCFQIPNAICAPRPPIRSHFSNRWQNPIMRWDPALHVEPLTPSASPRKPTALRDRKQRCGCPDNSQFSPVPWASGWRLCRNRCALAILWYPLPWPTNPTESLPFWSLSHCCWNAAAEGLCYFIALVRSLCTADTAPPLSPPHRRRRDRGVPAACQLTAR